MGGAKTHWAKNQCFWEKKSLLLRSLNITNFELLQTWPVEIQTHSNPGSSTKTELWTLLNPSKKPELRTYLAKNGSSLGPNLKKLNFEPFRTYVHLPKPIHPNPPKISNFEQWTGFDQTLYLEPWHLKKFPKRVGFPKLHFLGDF